MKSSIPAHIHGRQYTYTTRGCRCPLCCEAHRKANRKGEALKRRQLKALGYKPVMARVTDNEISFVSGYSKLVTYHFASLVIETGKMKYTKT